MDTPMFETVTLDSLDPDTEPACGGWCDGARGDPDPPPPPPATVELEPRAGRREIIGRDELDRIENPAAYPWRMICALEMRFGLTVRVGTGWLVGPRTVVTTGHCVFSHDLGFAQRILVIPGRAGSDAPHGIYESSQLVATTGWVRHASHFYDLGAIQLEEPVGERLGWFSVAAAEKPVLEAGRVTISGYPLNRRPEGHQWWSQKSLEAISGQQLFYELDTMVGHSGSPILLTSDPDAVPTVVGLHTMFNGAQNAGVRMTNEALELLTYWRES